MKQQKLLLKNTTLHTGDWWPGTWWSSFSLPLCFYSFYDRSDILAEGVTLWNKIKHIFFSLCRPCVLVPPPWLQAPLSLHLYWCGLYPACQVETLSSTYFYLPPAYLAVVEVGVLDAAPQPLPLHPGGQILSVLEINKKLCFQFSISVATFLPLVL